MLQPILVIEDIMKKVLIISFVILMSFSIHCQNVNYVELLNTIPTGFHLTDSLFNKYLGNDGILNKFKVTNYQRYEIKNKFINKDNNVITLLIYESQSVGNRAFLISFSKEGKIIDEKRIMNTFDGDDLTKPFFGYTYSLKGKQVKIKYCKTNPSKNYSNMWVENDSIWFAFININDTGYFFEFSKEGYSNKVRLFPEVSDELLLKSDLINLTIDELVIMRNEIFAIKGYIFKTNRFISYFAVQEWYNPKFENVGNKLSEIEKENIKLIKDVEQTLTENEKGNNKLLRGLWF